ncbi:hypothetical protein SLE2022_086800 [Rubroshorea leprosula]
MAAKPLTSEAIAITEKKMDMTLDDIIKMSQSTSNKVKKQTRAPNKNQKYVNNAAKERALKVRRYMDSRSFLRQGFLARRRSNFQGNQFPLAVDAAQKAVVIRARAYNGSRVAKFHKPRVQAPPVQRSSPNGGIAAKPHKQQDKEQLGKSVPKQKPQTLDSLFANMKEERMRVLPHKNNVVQRNSGGSGGWQRPPWTRRPFGN